MRRCFVFALPVLFLVIACSMPRARIHGTVRYKGKPLPGGTISFLAPDNNAYSSPISTDGKYEIAGVPCGSLRVVVLGEEARPAPKAQPGGRSADTFAGEQAKNDDKVKGGRTTAPLLSAGVFVPAQYADPRTSGLTLELAPPDKEFDVELN